MFRLFNTLFCRAGHHQTAHSFLLNTTSKDYTLPEVEIEWAEYKKSQVQKNKKIKTWTLLIWKFAIMHICNFGVLYVMNNWRVSKTFSGVTQLKIRDVCLFIYVWTYVCYFVLWPSHFCVCFVVYPFPTSPLNRIFFINDPVSFKEINDLPLCIQLFLNTTRFTVTVTQHRAVIL